MTIWAGLLIQASVFQLLFNSWFEIFKTLTDVYEKRSQFVYAKKSHPTGAKETAGPFR